MHGSTPAPLCRDSIVASNFAVFHEARYQTEAWCDTCAFIQLLHMRQHQNQRSHRQPLDNHIDPDHLNDLNRHILKESFRQARKLQTRLALDYHL